MGADRSSWWARSHRRSAAGWPTWLRAAVQCRPFMARSERARPLGNGDGCTGSEATSPQRCPAPGQRQAGLPGQAEFMVCEQTISTRARQLYPDALCQPMRPRSAVHRGWASRRLGAVSAASRGSTARSCPRRPAPRPIRAPRPRRTPTGKRSSSSGAMPAAAGRGRARPCALRRLRRTPQRDRTAWRSAIVAARLGPRANPPTRPSAADGRTDSPAPAATYRGRSRRSPAAERRHLHPDYRV